jgi:hypothetical protein
MGARVLVWVVAVAVALAVGVCVGRLFVRPFLGG